MFSVAGLLTFSYLLRLSECEYFHLCAWSDSQYCKTNGVQCTSLLHTDVGHHHLFSIIYNCVYTLFTGVGSFTNNIVSTVYRPIQAGGTTLYQFFSLGFNVLTLTLHLVYYTVALWLFCYVIILLHRFVQRRDFTVQGKFYFSPSTRCSHFGDQGQTLTIAPVLLDNCRQRVQLPNIIP